MTLSPHSDVIEIIWGVSAIAQAIGRNERATYHLLDQGALAGARKVGGRWCITRQALRDIFAAEQAA